MANVKRYFTKFSSEYTKQSRYSFLWYRWLIDTVIRQVGRPGRVVDLGSGTGELAIRLAARSPKSRVLGTDISEGMLKEARRRAKELGLKNVRFGVGRIGDKMPKADFVVSNLAVHHAVDKGAVAENAYKALSKGGKLVVGDWFKPSAKYAKEVGELRRKNPERAERFEKSFREFVKIAKRQGYEQAHPKEYPVCPFAFRDMMRDAGFRARVIKAPKLELAVVVGVKL